MDFKVRGYQSFCGEFLRTDVKISQKIIDEMNDDDQMQIRKIVSAFESELFWLLKDYAVSIQIKEEDLENGQTNEENSEENVNEAAEETPAEKKRRNLKSGAYN